VLDCVACFPRARLVVPTPTEQGAWWQVDLGSKKDIKQIIIYNRTDMVTGVIAVPEVALT
jgi:hypothetical protein